MTHGVFVEIFLQVSHDIGARSELFDKRGRTGKILSLKNSIYLSKFLTKKSVFCGLGLE